MFSVQLQQHTNEMTTNPISSNVFSSGADLVRSVLSVHFPDGRLLLDSTCSYRAFHKAHGAVVIGGDVRAEVAPDYIGDFSRLPFRDQSFDVGFFDPPFKRGRRRSEDFYTARYGAAPNNENATTKQYLHGLRELFRVCRCGVVCKFQDAADGHAFHDRRGTLTTFVRAEFGLGPHDAAILLAPGRLPRAGGGRQRFLNQGLSYFLVWKYARVSGGFKPVRF